MERIKSRYDTLEKALTSLEIPLRKISIPLDQEDYKIIRDSLIKRFEYTFEAFWQLLKQLLEDSYDIKTTGTRNIFREALRISLITEPELEILLKMVLDRNETVHAYREQIAQDISQDIPIYFKTMSSIMLRLKKQAIF